MLSQSIRQNAIVLAIFALVTALLLASTFLGTKDTIAASERLAAQKTLLEIFPAETHDNDVLEDTIAIPAAYLGTLGLKAAADLHVVRKAGNIVGFIIPSTAPDGYSGDIRQITGITVDGTIAAVRVLSHNETPGLGDKMELRKDPWILSFNGKSLGDPVQDLWKVKKDGGTFDQWAGATITPRAIVSKVRSTLIFYQEHRDELINAAEASARGDYHE
jgi:Na+-translocating ferredoxin:NAD+ oxidoreductase subunit G